MKGIFCEVSVFVRKENERGLLGNKPRDMVMEDVMRGVQKHELLPYK